MVFLALLAVWFGLGRDTSRSRAASPFVLALATLTRVVPSVFVPVLWWRWTWPERLLFGAVSLGLLLPFGFTSSGWGLSSELTGTGLLGSARVYSQGFRFNSGLYPRVEQTVKDITGSSDLTPATVAALMTLIGLTVWLASRREVSGSQEVIDRRLLRLLAVPVMAYIALTPVFHPWYLMLLLALAVFLPPAKGECGDRWLLVTPWLYLAAASVLSYLTYRDPAAFAELTWVTRAEWWPTLALLAISGFWTFFAVQAELPAADPDDQRSAMEVDR